MAIRGDEFVLSFLGFVVSFFFVKWLSGLRE